MNDNFIISVVKIRSRLYAGDHGGAGWGLAVLVMRFKGRDTTLTHWHNHSTWVISQYKHVPEQVTSFTSYTHTHTHTHTQSQDVRDRDTLGGHSVQWFSVF